MYSMGGDTIKIKDKVCELTDKKHKTLFSTGYTGKNMKKDFDILMFTNIIDDIDNTVIGNKNSKRKTFSSIESPDKNAEIEAGIEVEPEDLEGQGVKNVITSNIFDKWSRLEVLLGLELSGHSDTVTEAKNPKYDI